MVKPDPLKFCDYCATRLRRQRFGKRLEDMGAFVKRRFCTLICMGRFRAKPAPSQSALMKRAHRHRGNCCELCGGVNRIAAHHIDGNRLNDSAENIQTLCVHCHTSHHHRVRRAGLTVPGKMESHGRRRVKRTG